MTDSEFVPLGVLEEQILVAVLRTREAAYGMQVRREIERVTERDLAIGAVSATLDRLEARGLLTSRRGPARGWDANASGASESAGANRARSVACSGQRPPMPCR